MAIPVADNPSSLPPEAAAVRRTFLTLTFLATLAASLIRGIDALFLLDAGLSASEVFTVYAFMTVGTVVFEIPTGAVADIKGRRLSYLIGAFALAAGTLFYWYLWHVGAGFAWFAGATLLFGVAFTFFSGATEAWLVDALDATGYTGDLEDVFARNQMVLGAAMLVGTLLGGLLAQTTDIGVPYLVRAALLLVTFTVAFRAMHDRGFEPHEAGSFVKAIGQTTTDSIEFGWKVTPVRWMTLGGAFMFATMGYIFYAMQPYLLELYGDSEAYLVASVAATIVAGAQIVGGATSGVVRRRFTSRTSLIMTLTVAGAVLVAVIGLAGNFWAAIVALVLWSVVFAVLFPVRQAFLNAQIDSRHRATVLSVDSLVGSAGSIPASPALGRVADVAGYGPSFLVAAVVQIGALPFLARARVTCPGHTDRIDLEPGPAAAAAG
ncbi:MAG: MFS transporter [Acidimicrobiia bacterium]|nr:MFS transporter [Acidimicrobiia bacterium]